MWAKWALFSILQLLHSWWGEFYYKCEQKKHHSLHIPRILRITLLSDFIGKFVPSKFSLERILIVPFKTSQHRTERSTGQTCFVQKLLCLFHVKPMLPILFLSPPSFTLFWSIHNFIPASNIMFFSPHPTRTPTRDQNTQLHQINLTFYL